MTYEDREVPDAIVDVFARDIETARDDVILLYGQRHPALMKGLRANPASVPLLRRRLAVQIKSAPDLSPFVELLTLTGLNRRLLCVLSIDALLTLQSALARFYGRAVVAAGLLLDSRSEVRALAWRLVDAESEGGAGAGDGDPRAGVEIDSMLTDFLEETRRWAGPSNESCDRSVEAAVAQAGALRARVHEIEAQLDEVRRENRHLKKAGDSRAENVAATERMKRRVQALETETHELKAERGRLASELATLREALDAARRAEGEAIERKVRQAIDERASDWLVKLAAAEWRPCESSLDVETVARRAIEHQLRHDRLSAGNGALRAEMKRLAELKVELGQVCRDALDPLPELIAAIDSIDARMASIGDLLGDERLGPVAEAAMTEIAGSDTCSDLDALHSLVSKLHDCGLLAPCEARALYRRLFDRYNFLAVRLGEAEPTALSGLERLLAARFKNAIPGYLLIDGHNVLYALEDRFDPAAPVGEAAREALIVAVSNGLRGASGLRVRLYFDSSLREERTVSEQLLVVFSGGSGDHRADGSILEYLEHLSRLGLVRPIAAVVTDDAALRADSETLGAACLRVQEFAAVLSRRRAK